MEKWVLSTFIWKGKRLKIASSVLKEDNARGLILNLKTHYKARIVKTAGDW
jgi:hypothetical protein